MTLQNAFQIYDTFIITKLHFNIIREVKQRIARIFISIEELFLKARYLRNFVMTGTQNVDFTSDKQGCYF